MGDEDLDVSYDSNIDQINTLFKKSHGEDEASSSQQEREAPSFSDEFMVELDKKENKGLHYAVSVVKKGDERE